MSDFSGLRVGLVGPLPPPAGGMANQTRQLADLLRGEQATVELVQTNSPYRPAWVGRLPIVRAVFRLVAYLRVLWRAAGRCDVFHVMANSGWAWHLFAAPAVWVAWLRRVPAIVNYRGGEAATFLAGSHALVRWTLRRAAALAVPSDFLQQVFQRHGIDAQVLPNVVDLARFKPRDAAARAGAHLVIARHLEPIYDNATALRAFALVRERRPDARLTIAGSGPEEAKLHALAAELGLGAAVRFAGTLDRDAMAALYRDADVALNPSRADNMPNSLLEAMACGVPVVSTNVGGVPFLVEHERSALLVAPQDPPALAEATLRLLGDTALRRRLVRAGLQQVQRYTWTQVAPLLGGLYRAASRAGPAPTGA